MWLWICMCVLVQQLQYFYCEENITTTENIQTIAHGDVLENEIADKAKTQYSQTFLDRSTESPVLNSVSDNAIKCDQNENCPEINTHSTKDTQFPVSNEIITPISSKARTHVSMQTSALSETQTSERKPTATSEALTPGLTENETLASSLSHTSDSSETPTAIYNTNEMLITALNNADTHNRILNTLSSRNVTWSLVNIPNNSSQYTTFDMEQTDGFNMEESNLANHSLIVPQNSVTMQNAINETSNTMLSFLEISSTSTDQTTRVNQLTNSTTAEVASYFNNVETNLSHLDVVEGTTIFRTTKITPLTESDSSEGREEKVEKNNSHAVPSEMETMSTNDTNWTLVPQSSGDSEKISVTSHLETSVTTKLPQTILFSTTSNSTEVTEPSSIIIQQFTQKTDDILFLSTVISDVSIPNEYSSYDAPNTTTITPNIFINAMKEIVNHTLPTITTTTTTNNSNTSNSETGTDVMLTEKSDVANSFPVFTFETTLSTEHSSTTKILYTEQQPSSISYESTTNKETLTSTIKDSQSNLDTTVADSTVTSSLKLDLSSADVNLNTNTEHVKTTFISEDFSTSETYSSNEAKLVSTIFSSTFDSNSINANNTEISLNSTEIEYSTDTSSTEIIYNSTTIQYNTREMDHYFKTESNLLLKSSTGAETTSAISTVSESVTHLSGTDFSSEDENFYTTATSEFTNYSDLFSTIKDNSTSIVSGYIDNSSVLTSQDTSTTLVLREGKNIPFNNSVLLFTKQTESAFTTEMTSLYTAQEDLTTMRKKTEIFITQVRAEDLSPNEQANIITAVIQLSEVNYSQELLDQQTVTFHLWVLHAIIEGSVNNSMNSSGNSTQDTDEGVAYANLPSVVYILPTPVFNGTNLTFSFIAHNFWNNETFSADMLLKFLRAHSKQLHSSMNASLTLFLKGISTDLRTADWLEAIIDKHGIVILTTCLITVGIIVLLILAVVHYRIKHRQSVHCITDVDKLHRNIQEAIGIDLNPAVVILQDEVSEKTVLPNGDKICAMDDDEGWLVPITDVPIAEDSNASVQDTKL